MRTAREAEVCVVGAGPAGLVLAAELLHHGVDVLVLESGSEHADPAAQALNEGTVHGDPYAGLAATRFRGVGGTVGMWNTRFDGETWAKTVPLDAVDFSSRDGRPLTGWPFGPGELSAYYERALGWCGLRRASFGADTRRSAQYAPMAAFGPPLASRVYQLISRRALLGTVLEALGAGASSGREARLRTDATVVGLESAAGGRRVRSAVVASRAGDRYRVGARRFVLAAGAVENARLLLGSIEDGILHDESGHVGRCFMEHPRDTSIHLRPRDPALYPAAGFYDLRRDGDGTPVLGHLGIEGDALVADDLPNVAGTLLPRVRPGVRRLRRLLGPAARLATPRRLLPEGGHGWARHPVPHRVYDGFTLLLNVEQTPHPDNRIRLGASSDALGVRRPALHWTWRPDDRARLERLRRLVVEHLRGSGLFEVDVREGTRVDPNAHHHAGTARMHADAARAVVDPHLRFRAADNLYVAGASAFPTAGFANPLLTILALSLRLADHLARTG